MLLTSLLPPLQVSGEKEFFANMVVEAVSSLDPETLDLTLLGVKKVQVDPAVHTWHACAPHIRCGRGGAHADIDSRGCSVGSVWTLCFVNLGSIHATVGIAICS